jgi:ADP-ribosyl-[dinitrogen reductase] hydrolase
LFALEDGERAALIARAQSATTHAAPQAVDACDLFVAMLRDAIRGSEKNAMEPRRWAGHHAVAAIAAGSWRAKTREEISSSGYVVTTLEAALWSTYQAQSFEEALILAVNLGEDSDTVGAVTGQIAGAIWGASSIPGRWLAPLAWRERIDSLAGKLLSHGR